MKAYTHALSILVGIALSGHTAVSQELDLFDLPLNELVNMPVTSASRREEKLSRVPAALHVVTSDDIRRSGATTIADVLRMVPGLGVGRLSSHQWAISARGFEGQASNKLLVLIDGRSVYNPVFSGVFWDAIDTFLPDIERIEVIRGPGAAVWGANAVNGVINIVTKSNADTAGSRGSVTLGTEETLAAFRYGEYGPRGGARAYVKAFDRDNSERPTGEDSTDSWRGVQTGFRVERSLTPDDRITVQGDVVTGVIRHEFLWNSIDPEFAEIQGVRGNYGGGNVLGRWTHTFSPSSEFDLQAYYDRVYRSEGLADEDIHTFDLDLSHRWFPGASNSVVWGAQYRVADDRIRAPRPADLLFEPDKTTRHFASSFVQGEQRLFNDSIALVAGSKFEYDDLGGFNIQPSLRAAWFPLPNLSLWTALSRAVRSASRVDRDLKFNYGIVNTPIGQVRVQSRGNRNFEIEELNAYELGLRFTPVSNFSCDLSTYLHHYPQLQSLEVGPFEVDPSLPPPNVVIPQIFNDNAHGDVRGLELVTEWRPVPWMRIQGWYAYLDAENEPDPGVLDYALLYGESEMAQSRAHLRSSFDLPHDVQLDLMLRYVDVLRLKSAPSYTELDLRISRHLTSNLDLAFTVQNALNDEHPEFNDQFSGTQRARIERAAYVELIWSK